MRLAVVSSGPVWVDEMLFNQATPIVCGTTRTITIPNVGGTTNQLVEIYSPFSQPFYASYVLSIDAYCSQSCASTPFDP